MKTKQIIALDQTMLKIKESLLGVWDRHEERKEEWLELKLYIKQHEDRFIMDNQCIKLIPPSKSGKSI